MVRSYTFFACATQNHPIILCNSLIFTLRYVVAQKSDEVRCNVPECKTYQIFFLAKTQCITKYFGLTGNDLETSEILYFTLFCSNSKERFS